MSNSGRHHIFDWEGFFGGTVKKNVIFLPRNCLEHLA